MDRVQLLAYLNSHKKSYTRQDLLFILTNYCIDRGKTLSAINLWTTPIAKGLFIMSHIARYYDNCYRYALSWYSKQFNIFELKRPTKDGYETLTYY